MLGVVLTAGVAVATEVPRLLDVTRFQTVIEKLAKETLGCQAMQVGSTCTTVHVAMYCFDLTPKRTHKRHFFMSDIEFKWLKPWFKPDLVKRGSNVVYTLV